MRYPTATYYGGFGGGGGTVDTVARTTATTAKLAAESMNVPSGIVVPPGSQTFSDGSWWLNDTAAGITVPTPKLSADMTAVLFTEISPIHSVPTGQHLGPFTTFASLPATPTNASITVRYAATLTQQDGANLPGAYTNIGAGWVFDYALGSPNSSNTTQGDGAPTDATGAGFYYTQLDAPVGTNNIWGPSIADGSYPAQADLNIGNLDPYKVYDADFLTTDFVAGVFTVLATTHLLGTNFKHITIYDGAGNKLTSEPAVNQATGDITLSVPVGLEFNGSIHVT